MGKPLSLDLKEKIVSYWENNTTESSSPTFKSIADIFDLPRKTVSDIINRYKKTGSVENLPKTGRKKKTTARQDRQMVILSKRDPFMTAP